MIPVIPCVHYSCGGIKVDTDGQSTINRLYALGEVSSTGLHGANQTCFEFTSSMPQTQDVSILKILLILSKNFQALSHQPNKPFLCATFFVLGWIAKRLPHLVREIATRGHEVASHGHSHRMCNGLADSELRSELGDSKHLLEDITGTEVAGFRAPNFSVDDRVLSILQESGYRYDSSYNNFSLHGRYGKISLNGNRAGIAHKLSEYFFELPISNLPFFNFSQL